MSKKLKDYWSDTKDVSRTVLIFLLVYGLYQFIVWLFKLIIN